MTKRIQVSTANPNLSFMAIYSKLAYMLFSYCRVQLAYSRMRPLLWLLLVSPSLAQRRVIGDNTQQKISQVRRLKHRSSSISLSLSSPASRHRRPAHQPVQASPNIPHLGQQVPCHLVFVYLICPAPRIVRPASIYRIIVSLLQEAEPMRVKASLARSPPFSPLHQNSHSAVQGWRGGVRR